MWPTLEATGIKAFRVQVTKPTGYRWPSLQATDGQGFSLQVAKPSGYKWPSLQATGGQAFRLQMAKPTDGQVLCFQVANPLDYLCDIDNQFLSLITYVML